MEQNRLVIMLAAILLAVVAVSVGVLYFVPGDKSSAPQSPTDNAVDTVSGATGLNLDILQKTSYQSLDSKAVENGSLPVQPPTGVGKANPFL